MFEVVELGQKISKSAYKRMAPKLRTQLLAAQTELAISDFSVIILISGVAGAGKSELVNLLLKWLDARGVQIHAIWNVTDEERGMPPYWRFWRRLPPKGHAAIFFGSWYTEPLVAGVYKKKSAAELDEALGDIVSFEQMLVRENVLLLKFWLHLSRNAQKKRFKKIKSTRKGLWKISTPEKKFPRKYKKFRVVSEHAIRRTDLARAPWHIIDAVDERYRTLTVTKILLQALQERLALSKKNQKAISPTSNPTLPQPARVNIVEKLDRTLALAKPVFKKELLHYQNALASLAQRLEKKKGSLILVFEGPDAAGKGGVIRQLIEAIDARLYDVISVGAPNDEEAARPYLWRFWRNLPRQGHITIYDRSWYGRVLVERIEGFCSTENWQRAYSEINTFEEQLFKFGIRLIKFWLAISQEEQLRRFKDRQTTPYKQYKLTEEDWRNRRKWDAYEAAACDMFKKTSTEIAPWTLVEANDKYWARIKVLKTVCNVLKSL